MEVLQLAKSLSRDGNLNKAVVLLEEHMASLPNDLTVAAALGRIYMRLKLPEKAAYWLRYSLQSRYALPDLDQEDVEYLVEENPESSALDVDSEFGVATESSPAANDDDLEDLNDVITDQSVVQDVNRDINDPLWDVPEEIQEDFEEQNLESEDQDDAPTIEELSELLNDIPELDFRDAEEDEEEGDYGFIEVPREPHRVTPEDEEPDARLTVQEKAEGVAAGLAHEADWLRKDMGVLTEVLAHHKSHGKTIAALRHLLVDKEVTPGELMTLHEIRQLWGGGGYNRSYYGVKAKDGWSMVSWPLALSLVRQLRTDSAEEILLFVEDCFEEWSESPKQLSSFPIFVNYLGYVIEHMERVSLSCGQSMPAYIDYDFFEENDDGLDDWFEHRLTHDYLVIK